VRALLLIILSAIALNGCAIIKASRSPDYIKVKNKQDMAHAAYMGRFLLDTGERAVIEHRAMAKGAESLFPEYTGVASTTAIGQNPFGSTGGHIVTVKTERGSIPANLSLHPFSTPIGRRLLRTLTGNPGYYVYGRRLLGIIATQGKIFYAYTSSAPDFVQYEIAPETDATNHDRAGRGK